MMTLILGMKRYGKSTLARYLVNKHKRRLIIDPLAEHKGDLYTWSCVEFLNAFRTGKAQRVRTLVHRPRRDRGNYNDTLFEMCCNLRGYGILIDEVDKFAKPTSVPTGFENLINYQGHLGLDIYAVARRAARIPRDVTALCDTLCVFKMKEPNDLKYMKSLTGHLQPEQLRRLPKFKYLEMEL